MYVRVQTLLLLGACSLAASFQPPSFKFWYFQSSVVVDNWLYIAGGDIVTDSPALQFVTYTYSIDLSKPWTTSDVEPNSFSSRPVVSPIKEPMLWYNQHENLVHMWAGLPFNDSQRPGSYVFSPSENGGVLWANSSIPTSNDGTLQGLWGSAWAASPTAFYAVSGLVTLSERLPVTGMVTNDFDTDTWTNTTSADGFDSRFTFQSRIEYVPNFGDEGLLIAFCGEQFQNQLYVENRNPLGGFLSVGIYDIASKKWYIQETTGTVPPPVTDFCTVGVKSQDEGSYEVFMFGGRTNDTFDTTNSNDNSYKDIYILSLPAFTWIRAERPNSDRRASHQCQVIGNGQMLVIGGTLFGNDDSMRVDPWPNGIGIFDMSELEWTGGKYNPSAEIYKRPSVVQEYYQQNSKSPIWADAGLATIFPFRSSLTTSASSGSATSSSKTAPTMTSVAKASKANHTGAIVGGVVGAIAAIVIAVVGAYILLRKRRTLQKQQPDPSNTTSSELNGMTLYEEDAVNNRSYRHEMDVPGTPAELPGGTITS